MIKFYDEKGLIAPESAVGGAAEKVKAFGARAAVAAFSNHIFSAMLDRYGAKPIARVTGGCDYDVYGMTVDGKPVAAFKCPVGAPAAVMTAEEIFACGVESLVTFGICGALTDVPQRSFVVPTFAVRDEGTSRHYAPAAETVELKNAQKTAAALRGMGLEVVTGGAWCTDGFYRETRTRLDEVKSAGCIAVDMECAALQAMSDFRRKNFYTFFITADSLAGEEWQPNYILDIKRAAPDEIGADAAISLAASL